MQHIGACMGPNYANISGIQIKHVGCVQTVMNVKHELDILQKWIVEINMSGQLLVQLVENTTLKFMLKSGVKGSG